MDITEIQKDKKVILRPFDNGRRLKVVFQDLKDASILQQTYHETRCFNYQ